MEALIKQFWVEFDAMLPHAAHVPHFMAWGRAGAAHATITACSPLFQIK
jgi:hypothetical protein